MYEIDSEELDELELLFKSKKLFRYQGQGISTHCSSFENEFSSYLKNKHSLFVTSGTNALILALKALNLGKGDEVIVPSYTFVATIVAIIQTGAVPVVASINDSLTLDSKKLEDNLSKRTKAIIAVHMDGYPCDMDAINLFAQEHNLSVVEDVAQAVGGEYKGKKLGSFGRASCFSFNVDKIISCGEGGLVSFNEEECFKRALMLHDAPVRFGATFKDYLSEVPFELGYSMRMSEITAVIMRKQLKRLDKIIERLRENKRTILSSVDERTSRMILSSVDSQGECATHLHLRCEDPVQTGIIVRNLSKKGVFATPLYARPSHCYWQWQELGIKKYSDLSKDRFFISSTIRVPVDYECSPEELTKKALDISSAI